jgi:hypothetical protein
VVNGVNIIDDGVGLRGNSRRGSKRVDGASQGSRLGGEHGQEW